MFKATAEQDGTAVHAVELETFYKFSVLSAIEGMSNTQFPADTCAANQSKRYATTTVVRDNALKKTPATTKRVSGAIIRHRYFRYGLLLGFGLLLIWVPALAFVMKSEDVFKSPWSLIIPGTGIGSSLNIDSIGQTTTSAASPYSSSSVDPKVNYKAILMSSTVLNAAARSLEMTSDEYGKPLIKLIDQTAIIQLIVEDNSPDKAWKKSLALYDAFEEELERLRKDERSRIDSSNTNQFEIYRQQMNLAQKELLEFQSTSLIASSNKLELLLTSIDRLYNRRSDLLLEITSNQARRTTIEDYTGLSVEESSNVVKLQQDSTLVDLRENYAAVYGEYLERAATLGNRNPKVSSLSARMATLADAINERATLILGDHESSFVSYYGSVVSLAGNNFYMDQIAVQVELAAEESEMGRLDTLIEKLEIQIQETTRSTARLEELTRAYQVAETIYLSALAKQDLGKSDVYASYPMVQLLVPPVLPTEPEKLARIFAIAGALAGSIFILLSLVILWKRNALLQKLSKKE